MVRDTTPSSSSTSFTVLDVESVDSSSTLVTGSTSHVPPLLSPRLLNLSYSQEETRPSFRSHPEGEGRSLGGTVGTRPATVRARVQRAAPVLSSVRSPLFTNDSLNGSRYPKGDSVCPRGPPLSLRPDRTYVSLSHG